MLYQGLQETSRYKRAIYTLLPAISSIFLPFILSPAVYDHGLCGISGIADGLMAIYALEMVVQKVDRELFYSGMVCFWLFVGKMVYEAISDKLFWSFLHFGDVGIPIVFCHTGGFLGGCLAFLLVSRKNK